MNTFHELKQVVANDGIKGGFVRADPAGCPSAQLVDGEQVNAAVAVDGYMELDRRGAELLFQVHTEREEKNRVAIASNQSFSGWADTFTDPRLCAAIVNRLTYRGTIIETGTHSYRLAHTTTRHDEGTDTAVPADTLDS